MLHRLEAGDEVVSPGSKCSGRKISLRMSGRMWSGAEEIGVVEGSTPTTPLNPRRGVRWRNAPSPVPMSTAPSLSGSRRMISGGIGVGPAGVAGLLPAVETRVAVRRRDRFDGGYGAGVQQIAGRADHQPMMHVLRDLAGGERKLVEPRESRRHVGKDPGFVRCAADRARSWDQPFRGVPIDSRSVVCAMHCFWSINSTRTISDSTLFVLIGPRIPRIAPGRGRQPLPGGFDLLFISYDRGELSWSGHGLHRHGAILVGLHQRHVQDVLRNPESGPRKGRGTWVRPTRKVPAARPWRGSAAASACTSPGRARACDRWGPADWIAVAEVEDMGWLPVGLRQ